MSLLTRTQPRRSFNGQTESIALLLHGHDGSNREVGENYPTFQENRSATFARFESFVPTQFKELAKDDAPYGIPSPGNDPAFQAGGAYASYYTSNNPALWAGLNRHVAQLPAAEQSNPVNFCQADWRTTTPSSGTRTRSTADSTASPTTMTRDSPRTSR
jgi:hypothetical protein